MRHILTIAGILLTLSVGGADFFEPPATSTQVITISSRGIRNGKSGNVNDNSQYGPDTPGTTTCGIQEALNSIQSPVGWGTNITGAEVKFGRGDFFFTNCVSYSNTFITSILLRGASLLGTRLVYSGTDTLTNYIWFRGGGNPTANSMNIPLHVEVESMTLTSMTNTTATILCLTNYSYARVANCNFTSWDQTTNQANGPGVSINLFQGSNPGLVGLVIGNGNEHGTFVRDCFFAGLADGINVVCDHFYAENMKFALIGYGNGTSGGTGGSPSTMWPNTSKYSLGAAILRGQGLDAHIFRAHFYTCMGGLILDNQADNVNGVGDVFLSEVQFEAADHSIAASAPSKQQILISETAITDDSVVYSIGHAPYSYSITTSMDMRYAIYSKMIPGITLNGNGNSATNFNVLAASNNIVATNGFYSLAKNKVVLTSISPTGSPFNYTNTQVFNITVFSGGGTVSALSINGTAMPSAFLTGSDSIPLQPGEWITTTYSVAPTMFYKPL